MSGTMDIYLVSDPDVALEDAGPGNASPRDYLNNMLKAWIGSIRVRDVAHFNACVLYQYFSRQKKVRKMVIGCHGTGLTTGYGMFEIGTDIISDDDDGHKLLQKMMILRPVFALNADVYIMACKTGNDASLLRRISVALGNVRVHGYTDFVTSTNYLCDRLSYSVSDETDDGNNEIVCWPSECRNYSSINPLTGNHPRYNVGKPFRPYP